MKERKCGACETINKLEYTLRPNNISAITIRCKNCKRLLRIQSPPKDLSAQAI